MSKPPPLNQPGGSGSGEDLKMILSLMNQLMQILHSARTQMNQVQLQPIQLHPQQTQVHPQPQPLHHLMVQPHQFQNLQ